MRAKHPEKSSYVLGIVKAIVHEVDPEALYCEAERLQRLESVLGAAGVRLIGTLGSVPRLREIVRDLCTSQEMTLAYRLAVAVLDPSHYIARNLLNDLAEQFAMPPSVYRTLRGEDVGGGTAAHGQAAA